MGGVLGIAMVTLPPRAPRLSHHITSLRERVVADPLIRAASLVSYPYLIPPLHSEASFTFTELREKRPHVSLPAGNHDDVGNGERRRGTVTYTNPKYMCVSTCQDSAVEEMGQSDL